MPEPLLNLSSLLWPRAKLARGMEKDQKAAPFWCRLLAFPHRTGGRLEYQPICEGGFQWFKITLPIEKKRAPPIFRASRLQLKILLLSSHPRQGKSGKRKLKNPCMMYSASTRTRSSNPRQHCCTGLSMV